MDQKAATVRKSGLPNLTSKKPPQESKSMSPSKITLQNKESPEILGGPSKDLKQFIQAEDASSPSKERPQITAFKIQESPKSPERRLSRPNNRFG